MTTTEEKMARYRELERERQAFNYWNRIAGTITLIIIVCLVFAVQMGWVIV